MAIFERVFRTIMKTNQKYDIKTTVKDVLEFISRK